MVILISYTVATLYNFLQAAQATFKSIKSLVPLLDRVLVQRFKAETVNFQSIRRTLNINIDNRY